MKQARNWQKTHRDQRNRTRDPGQPQLLSCDKYTKTHIGGRGSISTNASGKTACPNVKNGIRALPLTQLKNSRAGDFPLHLFFGVGTQLHPSLGFRERENLGSSEGDRAMLNQSPWQLGKDSLCGSPSSFRILDHWSLKEEGVEGGNRVQRACSKKEEASKETVFSVTAQRYSRVSRNTPDGNSSQDII